MRGATRVFPAVVAVAATCAAVACSTTARRTAPERAADAELATRVEAALLADPGMYARHIDVTVVRGVVHLGGYVWEDDDFRLARNDAASVPGVRTVEVQMELMRGGIAGSSR
jgi:osmotically-inducible protein OsmY